MGNILGQIIGGGLGTLVKDVVGTFKLSPEEKQKFELAIAQNEQAIRMKEYELTVKAIDAETAAVEAASANIRAELATGDKFVSRGRPTYLYIMYAILVWNFILLPMIQLCAGSAPHPIDLPTDMYWLFGCGYLGYSGFRSLDKGGFKWNRGR